MGWELDEVERPLVEQLAGLGWRHIAGEIDNPAATGRASLIVKDLRFELRRSTRRRALEISYARVTRWVRAWRAE